MANYAVATDFPPVEELRQNYSHQAKSSQFPKEALSICRGIGIHVEDLTKYITDYLMSADASRTGVEDIQILMSRINEHFQLGLSPSTNTRLYRAVKALPHFSCGRIGYTHRRKGGGVFVFLLQ